jgi:hypothetical protein
MTPSPLAARFIGGPTRRIIALHDSALLVNRGL